MPDNWPKYSSIPNNFVHAIGMISIAWQEIESTYDFFLFSERITPPQFVFLQRTLNNEEKILFIQAGLCRIEKDDPEGVTLIRQFLDYARVCAENRNYIMHSTAHLIENEQVALQKRKLSKLGHRNASNVSVSELRDIADEMYATAQFGMLLYTAVIMAGKDRKFVTDDGETLLEFPPLSAPQKPKRRTPEN